MPDTRCVGGVPWGPSEAKLPQVILKLTREEAWELHSLDRLFRLNRDAGRGVRVQLLDRTGGAGEPRLLITGKNEAAVEETRSAVIQMLYHDGGQVIPMHPHDIQMLRSKGSFLMQEVEDKSGCRIVAHDMQESARADPSLGRKQPCLHLLGDQMAQARAVRILADLCTRVVLPEGIGRLVGSHPDRSLEGFDQVLRGLNIQLHPDDRTVVAARRESTRQGQTPSDCVVTGDGAISSCELGSFFCLGVRKVDQDWKTRGATRIGVSSLPVGAPLPESLVTGPSHSWVLGRGQARGDIERSQALPEANFDILGVGHELGVLVTKDRGELIVFHRADPGEDWRCLVRWDAGVPEPTEKLYAIVELAGRLLEVQLLTREPPLSVDDPSGAATLPLADAAADADAEALTEAPADAKQLLTAAPAEAETLLQV